MGSHDGGRVNLLVSKEDDQLPTVSFSLFIHFHLLHL